MESIASTLEQFDTEYSRANAKRLLKGPKARNKPVPQSREQSEERAPPWVIEAQEPSPKGA